MGYVKINMFGTITAYNDLLGSSGSGLNRRYEPKEGFR